MVAGSSAQQPAAVPRPGIAGPAAGLRQLGAVSSASITPFCIYRGRALRGKMNRILDSYYSLPSRQGDLIYINIYNVYNVNVYLIPLFPLCLRHTSPQLADTL
jgi:hypothetical protein